MSDVEKTPDVQVKPNEDIIGVIKEMKDVLTDTARSASETKELQGKMVDDLSDHISEFKDFQTVTEAQLSDVKESVDEQTDKSVFDVVMKEGSKVREQWGYDDSISRALYKPATSWDRNKGWVKKTSYEVDPILHDLNDALYLTGMHKAIASQSDPSSAMTYSQAVKGLDSYNLFKYELERNADLRKAMSSSGGSGGEFIPTGLSSSLVDDVRLQLKVAALFPRITMPARMGDWELPVRGSRRDAYLVGENPADSGTKIGVATPPSAKVTFAAKKHGLRMLFSYELDEDSAIAVMPLVREELVQALVDAEETAVVNGDTAGTHMDTSAIGATSPQKSWDGLRKNSGNHNGNACVDISTLSVANLRTIRKNMGRFGVNSSDLAWVCGISGFIQLLGLAEVLTVDKFGPAATIKNGQLANLDGAPIIISEFIKQDLNASGVFDNTTKTKTHILLANTRAFYTAEKPSGLQVETDRDIETQQNIAVATRRVSFAQVMTPGSGEETVGNGYNLLS